MSAMNSHCVEKTAYILSRCCGKEVLHVGCTNYPNTRVRLEEHTLLHEHLSGAAKRLDGIDLDAAGIAMLREAGFSRVYRLDACALSGDAGPLLSAYEVVVLGDIIEHSDAAQAILRGAVARLKKGGEIVLSVPNAFYWYGFLCALAGREVTHPEHVAYYSPANLRELARRNCLRIIEMQGYYEGRLTKKNAHFLVDCFKGFERVLITAFPRVSSGIICVMRGSE